MSEVKENMTSSKSILYKLLNESLDEMEERIKTENCLNCNCVYTKAPCVMDIKDNIHNVRKEIERKKREGQITFFDGDENDEK